MQKGDWGIIIIILILLILIALLTTNLDKLFPTPTVQQAIQQTIK